MKTKFTLLFSLFIALAIQSHAAPTGATINNPIFIGTLTNYGFVGRVNNYPNNGYGNEYGQVSDDVYYKFDLSEYSSVNISLCNSDFDTYVYLLDMNGSLIISNDDNGPLCTGLKSSIQRTLQPGSYYVVAEGYGSYAGNIDLFVNKNTNFPVGSTFENPIDLDAYKVPYNGHDTLSYFSNFNTKGYLDDFGRPTEDIIYKFTIAEPMDAMVITCDNSTFDTYIYILDENKNIIASNDDHGLYCTKSTNASLGIGVATNLPNPYPNSLQPGRYYLVTEGYSTTGMMHLIFTLGVNTNYFIDDPSKAPKLGSNDINETNPISISPNPASDRVNINFPTSTTSDIQILNNEGKLVKEFKTSSSDNTLDISDLQPGLYQLMIIQEGSINRKKLEVLR